MERQIALMDRQLSCRVTFPVMQGCLHIADFAVSTVEPAMCTPYRNIQNIKRIKYKLKIPYIQVILNQWIQVILNQ